ncbi:unnamed protein product [Fraxinus pennsylvanica]|uniref:Cytochrome P450 n=1 Tax=Fraxinus pennsylvanica TaxID=56036 RepID=A0AAD1ZTN0_9LAMI|nr:unnamed protein product [Fraxinus pennsylvanica]
MDYLFGYIPLIIALHIFTKHSLRKLKNLPPSPLLNLPIFGHLHLLEKPLYRSLAKISDSYGPILLLQFGSRRVLVVSSPSSAEECLHKNDIIFANRPNLIAGKHIGNDYTTVVWSPYGDHWRNLRKISSIELLSTHRLEMLQSVRTDEIKDMIKTLHRYSDARQTVDMKTAFYDMMMNVMMRMIAGKKYYGENVEDIKMAKRFREIVHDTPRIVGATRIQDFLPVLRWLGAGGAEKRLVMLQKKRDMFMQELVEQCKKGMVSTAAGEVGRKDNTMIEVLLKLQEKEPEYYTDRIIRNLVMARGTNTSAGTMEWALSLLLNNPEVLKKAQTEIDNHIGNERIINESDIANLPY